MTREEAIEYLKRADTTVGQTIKTRTAEALEMAIEALKQKRCGKDTNVSTTDAISRQHFDERVRLAGGMSDEELTHDFKDGVLTVLEMLKTEPSVQPEIIRCCQCKYAEVADSEDSQDGYTCQFHRGSIWFSGSYCSWAERRQDG